ncbi:MAG: hypothetical protein DCF15_01855 [Phormidesmis priestleyi]|uniref:Uncharacterized protein n=1 Tax=Phormidesmis priestleyi TaxID=268141 RepID=A0A2W4Y0R1_9CYAN|nr:MAG: hypothetical protein DCF15_01855 [Phormidesmis priestleyi]
MSENQLPRTSSDASAPNSQNRANNQNRAEQSIPSEITGSEVASSEIASSEITSSEAKADSEEGWESADLPGTLNFIPAEGILPASAASQETAQEVSQEVSLSPQREDELLTLIHDLNECNDVLLVRISQLESALETSQAVLDTEVENAKFAQNRLRQQVSAEQVSAQQFSHTAQQQVAQLVDQLDRTEQLLSRQTLVNENLKTELNNAQERIVQLEKESALTLQQHAEAAEAQRKAEAISRDLRSRLQRQQRYTLQFKAALEKSLTVSARPSVAQANSSNAAKTANAASEPVPMPKAQRIMPWAFGTTTAFTGIDPHLETLIRGIEQPAHQSQYPSHNPSHHPADVNELEAEAELWQDLERVMFTEEETPAETLADTISAPPKQMSAKMAESFAAASKPPDDSIQPAQPAEPVASTPPVGFSEPSPWGKPLPDTTKKSEDASKATAARETADKAVEEADSTGISPIVKEWRSPRKLTSLSAVQLPTFEKAKAGSFRR